MNDKNRKSAKVVHTADPYTAVINRGSDHDVKKGDIYLVFAVGPELSDPDTGESLGNLEIVRGRAKVQHVQPLLATIETIEFDEVAGRRKIIRKEGHPALFSMGAQREEIEEGPERHKRELYAEIGDFAKLVSSG